LPNSHKLYVFRYGTTALYALTTDSTGRNLPSQTGAKSWRFKEPVTLEQDKSSPKYELIKATLAAIAKHGFILTHAAIQPLPVAIAQRRTKKIKVTEQLASSRL
jgi:hypothetical protein